MPKLSRQASRDVLGFKLLSYMNLQPTLPQTSSRQPRPLFAGPMVVAILLLGLGAFLSQFVTRWLDIKLAKKPLALQLPLSQMSESAVAPYRVAERNVLPREVIARLGTTKYLSWTLEDESVGADDPLRYARLFVTFYTGGHNLVPHTPDQCYVGGGYNPAQPHENMKIDLPALPEDLSAVPIRVCTFVKTGVFGNKKLSVVYTFNANGRFVSTRTGVRLAITAPTDTYAYFSKVEVSFPNATRAQSIEGARSLFDRVLPALLKNHWPDHEAAERAIR